MSLVKAAWIDAASTAGVMTDPEEVTGATRFSLQVTATGDPTDARVDLDMSIDGVNWAEGIVQGDLGGASNGLFGYGNTGTAIVPKYIRARVDTLTGGTAPTVSASLLAI